MLYKKNKKNIAAIVSVSLLIVVTVFSILAFNNWFETYSSQLFSKTEVNTDSSYSMGSVEFIIGDQLYLKSLNKNLSVRKIIINNVNCNISINFSGIYNVSIGDCLNNLNENIVDIVLVTDNKIISKKVYLNKIIDDEHISLPPVLNPSSDFAFGYQSSLSSVNASFIGQSAGSYAGEYVSYAGDVNGDGFDDFVIGATRNGEGGTSAGKIYLILGKSNGWLMDTSLSSADASFIGEETYDFAGSVSGVGDVNGDGFDDFVIIASQNDEGVIDGGQVYLIFGKSSGWATNVDLSTITPTFLGERVLEKVCGVGDVNGDGFDDFLISSKFASVNKGKTYLILGKSTGWNNNVLLSTSADASFIGEAENDYSSSIGWTGDVNGDGFDDFLIGGNYNSQGGSFAGKVHLILGKSSGWVLNKDLSTEAISFIGESSDDNAGTSVSGVGDVNGDGFDDFAIGAPYTPNFGRVYLFYGKNSGWTANLDLSLSDEIFIGGLSTVGRSLSFAGDVNSDGFDDFLIGAHSRDSSAGQTYLILGTNSGWTDNFNLSSTLDVSFLGEVASDYSGKAISNAGDVNGDGFDDFLIGAYGNDAGGSLSGQVYLILGGIN